jgi:hypothetical protein
MLTLISGANVFNSKIRSHNFALEWAKVHFLKWFLKKNCKIFQYFTQLFIHEMLAVYFQVFKCKYTLWCSLCVFQERNPWYISLICSLSNSNSLETKAAIVRIKIMNMTIYLHNPTVLPKDSHILVIHTSGEKGNLGK